MEDQQQMSRRTFLKAAAAAGVLAAGGAGVWMLGGVRAIERTAEQLLGDLSVLRLRQIITRDPGHTRMLMWEMAAPTEHLAAELRALGADASKTRRFPAADDRFTDDGAAVFQYAALLDGLTPGADYLYRIVSGDAATDWLPLAAPAKDAAYKMLIFPDAQSSDYTDWQNLARAAWARNQDAALFCGMGDLVDNGEDRAQWIAFFAGLTQMQQAVPFVPVMGNHETYNRDWKVRLPEAYLHYFITPSNGSASFDRYYYSFDYGDVHYIVLCTQQHEISEFADGLVDEQLAWMRRDMQEHRKKWNIVLMHKDVLQYRIHGRAERTEGIDEENGRIWMPMFDALGIDIVFTAHLHTYRNRGHIYAFQKSAAQKGPLYILTGVAGNVRYPNLWVDHAFDEVTLPQPETDNYLTMEIRQDAIEVACFLPDGTEMDRVQVRKRSAEG